MAVELEANKTYWGGAPKIDGVTFLIVPNADTALSQYDAGELDFVDGIPDEYLKATSSYEMTPEQRVEWEAEVRSLYDGMVRIVVTPTWAKLIDFETTLPSAVEELVRQRDERQRA